MNVFLKGLWIGGTMTVPGVSGGTMAVVVGIYEKLITSLMELKKEPKKNLLFLSKFLAGSMLGFLVFARGVTFLLEQNFWGELLRFFFCGVVAGGVPLLVRQSGQKKVTLANIMAVVMGALIVYGLSTLPVGLFVTGSGIQYMFLQLLGGFVVAIALVLPGISVSHMLFILGLYEPIMEQVYSFQIISLLPFAIGVLLGCFLTAGIMKYLLEHNTGTIYMIIIGFVAASVVSLLPPQIHHMICGLLTLGVGAVGMYLLTGKK